MIVYQSQLRCTLQEESSGENHHLRRNPHGRITFKKTKILQNYYNPQEIIILFTGALKSRKIINKIQNCVFESNILIIIIIII